MKDTVAKIKKMMGEPRNYGPTPEEREEMKRVSEEQRLKRESEERADRERREAEEAAERKQKQEEWASQQIIRPFKLYSVFSIPFTKNNIIFKY